MWGVVFERKWRRKQHHMPNAFLIYSVLQNPVSRGWTFWDEWGTWFIYLIACLQSARTHLICTTGPLPPLPSPAPSTVAASWQLCWKWQLNIAGFGQISTLICLHLGLMWKKIKAGRWRPFVNNKTTGKCLESKSWAVSPHKLLCLPNSVAIPHSICCHVEAMI